MRKLIIAVAGVFLWVLAADAHVRIVPGDVRANGFESFTVRVPTEKEEPTVKVRVEFPGGLQVSRFRPVAGWTYELEKDAAGKIVAVTWSGGSIAPNEYQEFGFMARAPKEPGKLSFKAYQTYQSGITVAWVGEESSREPAPVVTVRDSTWSATAPTDRSSPTSVISYAALAIALSAFALAAATARRARERA